MPKNKIVPAAGSDGKRRSEISSRSLGMILTQLASDATAPDAATKTDNNNNNNNTNNNNNNKNNDNNSHDNSDQESDDEDSSPNTPNTSKARALNVDALHKALSSNKSASDFHDFATDKPIQDPPLPRYEQPRGGVIVETIIGNLQFGMPPETIKVGEFSIA